MDRWLSLKIIDQKTSDRTPHQGGLLIAIPKKIIASAVKRNRLKRLIKEAVRLEKIGRLGLVYKFRVDQSPKQKLNCSQVRQLILALLRREASSDGCMAE
jgi:ribonuclease P protein component